MQQVGSPRELHTRPANWHVADFMGYRNLWPGRVEQVDGVRATVGSSGHQLVGEAVGDLRAGVDAVVAVRPEDVRVDGSGETRDALPATIEVVEYQGRELAAEARTDTGLLLHLRTEQRIAPGDQVKLAVDPRRLLVYPADAAQRADRLADVAEAAR